MSTMQLTLLLGAIGVVFALPLGYYAVYAPQQRQVGLIRAQVAQEDTTQQTRAEVAALLEQVERYQKRLPPAPDPSWLARGILMLAREAGIQVKSISQEPLQEFEFATRLSVTVDLSATYHQLGTLLDMVEGSSLFLRVERLTISRVWGEKAPMIRATFSTIHLPPVLPGPAAGQAS